MARFLIYTIVALILHAGTGEAAQKVLALQSYRVAPYEQALQGAKSVIGANITKTVLSDIEGMDIAKKIRLERPDVILAIGSEALARVKKIKDTPIVYLMVLDSSDSLANGENITGISMNVAPERQIASYLNVIPRIKKVGILYTPARGSLLFRRAQSAAKGLGVEVIAREVRNSREVFSALEGMKGEIDAFWMLPDPTVVTPETVELLLLFCLNHKIPVLTFSDKYVEMGALIALDLDPVDLGRQAGEQVRKIFSGTPARNIPRSDPRSTVLTVNGKIARKLGIALNEEALGRARMIR